MQKHPEVHAMVMGGLEKISESLQLAESKKNRLEKSILSLIVEWKDFEGKLDLAQKDFSEALLELDSKEKKLASEKESMELTRELVEQRFKEVGNREKDFALFCDKKIRDLEFREDELVRIKETYAKEVVEQLNEQEKRVQELLAALKSEKLHMESLKNFVEKRFKEMELEEKSLENKKKEVDMIQISIEKRTKELEHNEGKIKERERKAELKEEEMNWWKEHQSELMLKERQLQLMIEDIEFQEKKSDFIRQFNEKRMEELELKEKQFEKNFKQDFHLKEKGCGFGKQFLEKGLKDLEAKMKGFEEEIKEFELRKKELGESLKEFDLKNKDFLSQKTLLEEESEKLKEKKDEFEYRIKQFEFAKKELEESLKEFNLKKKESLLGTHLLEKDSKHLESRRKELEESIEKFKLRERELELKEKKFESEKKLLEDNSKHLESRRKELEESIEKFKLREKELDLREKQFGSVTHAQLKTQPIHNAVSQSLSCNLTDVDLRFVVVMMGGKDLQVFLNERGKDHHLMAEEVLKALRLSQDPAKLVLDAMEGFFPPHLRKGNEEFSGNVVRRSCMLLLQQLIRISPQIQPCVREEALKLAKEWKTKLNNGSPLEVSSFLYLLVAYDVASAFDAEDIMICLESVSKHQQKLEPELCGRLGLKEKIPSVIENLLKSNQSMEAIKFIYGFELVDCFPPVPILKNYLKHVKMYANTMLRKRHNKENVQNESIDIRIAALKSVIRCIVDYKLESEYSPKHLENSIKQLLMQKKGKKFSGSSNCHKNQGKQRVEVKQISSTAAPSQRNACSLAPDLSNTVRGLSHPMAVIIANMDGKNLLSFLSSHVVEHESLRNEVSSALQISDNSPKLVLDAVENLYDSHLTEEEANSCIFLLEQLMRLSPDIMPDVKEAAQNIAFDWQAKLKAKNGNSLLTLTFLLLISTYRLDSTFHRDELRKLYQTVAEQKLSPGLSDALGISKDLSNIATLQSQVETRKVTSKSSLVNNLIDSTSMVPELDGEPQCTNMDLEGKECVSVCSEVPNFINFSSDPTSLILDALKNCHRSNFSETKNPRLVVKSFSHLLEQLMTISPEIKPNVKERAYEFALHWRAKSTGPHSWQALVFLQLVASYQLSSFFSSDELFCLLEAVYQPQKAGDLIRMFGLVDKVPGFITKLIMKKKLLLAFAYVYDFKLVDMFSPIALLKEHVLYSKVVAEEIFHKGQKTTDAQYKSIVSEISALKAVIRLIVRHHLQSEYSPYELRSTIKDLESRTANLKTSMEKVDANEEASLASEVDMQQVNTKRRPRSDSTYINEAHLQPASKLPRLVLPSQISKRHPIQSKPSSSQHPGDCNAEPCAPSSLRRPSRPYSSGGSPLVFPPQNEFLPPNHNATFYNYMPPLTTAGKRLFYPGWRNPYPN